MAMIKFYSSENFTSSLEKLSRESAVRRTEAQMKRVTEQREKVCDEIIIFFMSRVHCTTHTHTKTTLVSSVCHTDVIAIHLCTGVLQGFLGNHSIRFRKKSAVLLQDGERSAL